MDVGFTKESFEIFIKDLGFAWFMKCGTISQFLREGSRIAQWCKYRSQEDVFPCCAELNINPNEKNFNRVIEGMESLTRKDCHDVSNANQCCGNILDYSKCNDQGFCEGTRVQCGGISQRPIENIAQTNISVGGTDLETDKYGRLCNLRFEEISNVLAKVKIPDDSAIPRVTPWELNYRIGAQNPFGFNLVKAIDKENQFKIRAFRDWFKKTLELLDDATGKPYLYEPERTVGDNNLQMYERESPRDNTKSSEEIKQEARRQLASRYPRVSAYALKEVNSLKDAVDTRGEFRVDVLEKDWLLYPQKLAKDGGGIDYIPRSLNYLDDILHLPITRNIFKYCAQNYSFEDYFPQQEPEETVLSVSPVELSGRIAFWAERKANALIRILGRCCTGNPLEDRTRTVLVVKVGSYRTLMGNVQSWIPFYISSGQNSREGNKGNAYPAFGYVRALCGPDRAASHTTKVYEKYINALFVWPQGTDIHRPGSTRETSRKKRRLRMGKKKKSKIKRRSRKKKSRKRRSRKKNKSKIKRRSRKKNKSKIKRRS